MLKNTFFHVPGISKETEQEIWKSNIYTWDEFLKNHHKLALPKSKKQKICSHIEKSVAAYKNNDYSFFVDSLPSKDHWRTYTNLKNKCCFLDIETTGLSRNRNDITVIGLYNGKKSKFFVNGQNMDDFSDEIKKYPLIVTFNGKCFDIPFIQAKFPSVNLDKLHVDLRFAMRTIGYSGGLKRIEKEIGIERDIDLQEIDGFEAVRLWHKYKRGNDSALDLLIKYNQADIENLKVMMDFAYSKLKEKELFAI